VTVRVEGTSIVPQQKEIAYADDPHGIVFSIRYAISPVKESIVIKATAMDPTIDRRNDAIYKNALFNRDDQIFDTLAAGINAGQHEGGGKLIEVRRFGYNLDHGGVSGGLKVLVDNVQQNQGTQGHGQGYLGQLKSLTPELVEDVDILNGPFSAEYGDTPIGWVARRLRVSWLPACRSFSQQASLVELRSSIGWYAR
jgi:TonB-dependent Receptor Plug Domain